MLIFRDADADGRAGNANYDLTITLTSPADWRHSPAGVIGRQCVGGATRHW